MDTWRPFGAFVVGVADLGWLGVAADGIDPEQHLAGRLYYPCDAPARRWGSMLWHRGAPWLPGYNYASGLANFVFFRRKSGWLQRLLKRCVFIIAYVLGKVQRMGIILGAPPAAGVRKLPVVLFSHGLAGQRSMYSISCSELASQGYLVLALEHADGTASAAQLACGKGWRFYRGLGGRAGELAATCHRLKEMGTALRVLRAMHEGTELTGTLEVSGGLDPATLLRGALDLDCCATIGHSYGGSTATAFAAEEPAVKCAVAFDPWWYALPEDSAALCGWRTRAPLLVLGSHDWNIPNERGELTCGGDAQRAVLNAARLRHSEGQLTGGGAMLLVIAGSSHNTFADPLPLFSQHLEWLLGKLGLAARLDPEKGIHLANLATLSWLAAHLPLSAEQRNRQNWWPGEHAGALRRIGERDRAGVGGTGPLSRMLTGGRGLLTAASDAMLNQLLLRTTKADGEDQLGVKGRHPAPDDVVTGEELLESALPSSDPASGPRPHAPRQQHAPAASAQELEISPSEELAGAPLALGAASWRHAQQTGPEDAARMAALLEKKHVFLLEVSM